MFFTTLNFSFALLLLFACCGRPQVGAAIHGRAANTNANSIAYNANDKQNHNTAATIETKVNTDFTDKMSWRCANNASCLYSLYNSLVQSYRRGDTINLGFLDVVKLPKAKTHDKTKNSSGAKETGRGISQFVDFISGNAIRIPVGPMVFSVQRAEDKGDYIEIALLKKAVTQGRDLTARRGGDGGGLMGGSGGGGGGGLLGGGGGGGGLLGGGGGNGGGGGEGHGLRNRKSQDKKQFQMYIPMYLAATTFGWTLVAAKAVGLLTLKALAVSKLAFVVAAMVIIKKLMDNASEKMMYQYPEHTPYMMPYGMDYPIHAMSGADLAANEMYPAALHLAAAAAAPMPHHQGHPGLESYGAESNLHPSIVDVQNNTQVMAALNAAGLGQKVKRDDAWIAKTTTARRPLVYNYLQPSHPYYRV